MSNTLAILTGLIFIVFASCSGSDFYSRFHHIENGIWYRDSSLVFSSDSLSFTSDAKYDVTVELTTNRSYLYRDIWLLLEQNITDSLVHTDTLRCLLADEHGKWLGSGVGGLHQMSLPYFSFVPGDSVYCISLTISHLMDDDPLRGVEKVGIKISTADGSSYK